MTKPSSRAVAECQRRGACVCAEAAAVEASAIPSTATMSLTAMMAPILIGKQGRLDPRNPFAGAALSIFRCNPHAHGGSCRGQRRRNARSACPRCSATRASSSGYSVQRLVQNLARDLGTGDFGRPAGSSLPICTSTRSLIPSRYARSRACRLETALWTPDVSWDF